MADSLKLDVVLPVKPAALYDAWLDSKLHAAFTGGGPAAIEKHVGGSHSAWDRYATGVHQVLERGKKIVQTWRTTEFAADAPDSLVTILFEAVKGGTLLTVVQENLPEGTAAAYLQGWDDYYFKPMLAFFAPKPKAKAKPKKKAAVKAKPKKKAASKTKKKAPAKKKAVKKPARAKKKGRAR